MSFDLFLTARKGEKLPAQRDLAAWAKKIGHFKATEQQLVYENTVTGVYFTLGRQDDSLALNLNYCRPTFFALECFEVLADLAKQYPLEASDPQGDGEPQAFNAEKLVASWRKGNGFACKAMTQLKKELLYLEETKATELWRYLRAYPRLKKEYDDEIFVPQVLVVEHKGTVLRGAHLTRPTSYVWPPVDVFWLMNNGIVPASRVSKVLLKHLTNLSGEPGVRHISEETCFDIMDDWDAMYDELEPETEFELSDVCHVACDGFVDVEL